MSTTGGGKSADGRATTVAPGQGAALETVSVERVTDIPSSCTARVEIINMTHTAEGEYDRARTTARR